MCPCSQPCGILPEVVGEDAVVVDPYQVDAIAGGLERLYTDAALREKLKKAGPLRAAKFTWEASAKQLYAVYQESAVSEQEQKNCAFCR